MDVASIKAIISMTFSSDKLGAHSWLFYLFVYVKTLMCKSALSTCMPVYHVLASCHESQRRVMCLLKLKLQTMCVLGI